MTRRKRGAGGGADADETTVDRVIAALERWPDGMHDLGEPTVDLPNRWPPAVVDVYLAMCGARLFGDTIVLHPPAEVAGPDDDGRYLVGEVDGEPVWFDGKGRVWREDPDTGERIVDGTAFDRWLHGVVDASALLFDPDGEYAEAAFTEEGELTPEIALARARAQVKRDGRAPGPRWRLARLLAARGDLDPARRELEDVVAQAPTLPWAWLDLARISEKLGDLPGALDEAAAAADADPGHEQRPYFLAEAARLAALAGDDGRRAEYARAALALDADLVRAQLSGAEDQLAADELDAAAHLAGLARALAPRDLAVIDLVRRVDEARKAHLH
ncbi:MAG TPA: tetratricopeptide repeat protein [Kofleriaceae bacterium]|nr:tetratricopeptide repeat protein [Kofleriaceae bacterium]